jgi:outer membrane protein OmpA-like peptidoglycan-associated protein
MKQLLLTAALVAMPLLSYAQPVSGLYIAGGAGANFMPPEAGKYEVYFAPFTFSDGNFRQNQPAASLHDSYHNDFAAGFAGVASIGYGLGNGLRFEVEGDYRYNPYRYGSSDGEQKYGGMANALFDFDLGLRYLYPYAGGGVGYMRAEQFSGPRVGSFAYQGIAGFAIPVPWVPGLSTTFEYRFMGLAGAKYSNQIAATSSSSALTETFKYSNDLNNSLLIGVRYAFGVSAPVPLPAPIAEAPPAPAPARTYLVFFDWDRADLTDRAKQIIAEAASASTHVAYAKIEVQGNADRSGTPAYNLGLSKRRAETVAAELVRRGVPRTAIDIEAFGDTRPLVPTAAGVREPQNRRVAIILR